MACQLNLWQKIQEIAPSHYPHDRDFLRGCVGSDIGRLTIRTMPDMKVLGTITLEGTIEAALIVRRSIGLGRSGGEMFEIDSYQQAGRDPITLGTEPQGDILDTAEASPDASVV